MNQEFFLRVDCKSAKSILQNDVKNIASKNIIAKWQAILSNFDFQIEYIKGENNSILDFLTHGFCRIHGIIAPKKTTRSPKTTSKPLESQSFKISQDPSPYKMLWCQQVELEEEQQDFILLILALCLYIYIDFYLL